MKRLFRYVDETGQNTEGDLFVVAVVIAAEDRERLLQLCEEIERETGKGRLKWIKTEYGRRIAYIQRLLDHALLQSKVSFAVHCHTRDYVQLTTESIARALEATGEHDYRATILIDGLPRSQEVVMGGALRRRGVPVRKVRGVKRDENDSLIRLADAMCGLVRAAREGQPRMQELLERGLRAGALTDLSQA
ncbi:MAG: DUF3800 domain-containing protein [Armatimonadetes bacterium]|nr:DUF3800 domain-containing protein [Armatimonadota bacterium]